MNASRPAIADSRLRQRSISLTLGLAFVWFVLLAVGWSRLYSYTYHPEETHPALAEWPRDAPFGELTGLRMVLFVHPLCPCTQATLQELSESLARMPEDASVVAVPVTIGLSADEVSASRLIASVRKMPHIKLHLDRTGEERRRFGAQVSGEVFAFDRSGRCVFHGGLTPGRGHQGDSTGQRHLEELTRGERSEPCEAPVFGCRLPGADGATPCPVSAERVF